MIKEIKTLKLKEHTEKRKFCDVCKSEIRIGLTCSKAVCEYCGKDLCNECVGHEEESGGDYRICYCKECWKMGEKYRPLIEEHEKEIDRLYAEWQLLCKK